MIPLPHFRQQINVDKLTVQFKMANYDVMTINNLAAGFWDISSRIIETEPCKHDASLCCGILYFYLP